MTFSGKPFSVHKRKFKHCIRWYVQFRREDGTWSTAVSTGQTSKGAAEGWALNKLREGPVVSSRSPTLAEYAVDFFADDGLWVRGRRLQAGTRLTLRTLRQRQALLDNHVVPALGKLRLAEITTAKVVAFQLELNAKGLSNQSLNHCLAALKIILDDAHSRGKLSIVPAIKMASENAVERGVLGLEEARAVLALEWDSEPARTASLLSAATGLRIGEAQALRRCDLDLDHGLLEVNGSWNEADLIRQVPKSGKPRRVPLPGSIVSALRTQLEASPWKSEADFVFFTADRAKPMGNRALSMPLYRALAAIGISETARKERGIVYHSWRHFANSLMVNSGIPLLRVQGAIGHASDALTKHYFHADDDLADIRAVQNAAFGPGGVKE